jgi:RNA polymerase sigma factor (sigma-70 family)
MQKWQKDRNYRKYENEDGSFTYIIKVDGQNVEVNLDVYTVYSQADRRERYCAERDAGRLLSLDWMDKDDFLLSLLSKDYIESAENAAFKTIQKQQVVAALNCLELKEKRLIHALIINDVSEREYAALIGLSQKGVNKRKHKILGKLKKMVLNQ